MRTESREQSRRGWMLAVLAVLAMLGLGLSSAAAAPKGFEILASENGDGVTTYSVSIQTLLVFSMLSFMPAILLLMTSFTRIVIVLSLMRQALGLQSTPPNQVIIGMSLFLTFYVMAPTLESVYEQAYQPYSQGEIEFDVATERAGGSMKTFMLAQTRSSDLRLFADMAKLPEQESLDDVPLRVLVPAFVISELKTAFQVGFMIFIPFLIIDLVVASILMSMGMMMLSPVLVALPFKLMFFVLADGWHLLVGSMVQSFKGI